MDAGRVTATMSGPLISSVMGLRDNVHANRVLKERIAMSAGMITMDLVIPDVQVGVWYRSDTPTCLGVNTNQGTIS